MGIFHWIKKTLMDDEFEDDIWKDTIEGLQQGDSDLPNSPSDDHDHFKQNPKKKPKNRRSRTSNGFNSLLLEEHDGNAAEQSVLGNKSQLPSTSAKKSQPSSRQSSSSQRKTNSGRRGFLQ